MLALCNPFKEESHQRGKSEGREKVPIYIWALQVVVELVQMHDDLVEGNPSVHLLGLIERPFR